MITIEDIASLEERLKLNFPKQFESFLLQYNGGYCLCDYPYKLEKYKGVIGISIFLGIQQKHIIEDVFMAIQEMHGNANWLPFGFDSGNWIFCLSIKSETYGQVYLMRTDEDEPDAFRLIAKDFNEFTNGLKTVGSVF